MAFVIGASGATIKFIESASGCKLETSKDGGAKPTAVTLKGGRDAVDKARKLVLAAVSGVDVTAEATETLELAQAGDIATIIGKGGSTIKALQASTGARVDAQRRSSGPAAVVVSGTKDQVAAAVLAIKGLLADASNSEILELACHVGVILGKGGTVIRGIQDASQARVDVAAVDGAQDRCIVTLAGSKQQIAAAKALVNAAVDDKDKPVLEPGDVLENVVLPEACVGTIIGKGGESIKKLQAETGAKVDVSKTKASCAVYGPSAAVKKAVAFIRDVVDKQAKLDAQKLVERLAYVPAPTRKTRNTPNPESDPVSPWIPSHAIRLPFRTLFA
ncbi:hypothetical protein M885DRAFT_518971 [Pelagophyceae sp. CCMP2097]|nr:hypothetical protein M885DRAFT_518971 [Pelagophyceae sp. CCMP2097]